MNKFILSTMIFALFVTFFFATQASANEDNRVLDTDTLKGNNLYTAKFEGNSYCTAVLISPTVALTAKHCEGNTFKEGSLGTLYPAVSGISTNAGKLPITTYIPYDGNYDIAILKGENPSNDFSYYIKDGVKISKERNLQSFIGKDVYTIGYPQDKGENYQYKTYGKVLNIEGQNMISTDLYTFGGQSGSGLYLKETNELIGILYGNGRFTAIDSTMRDWISTKTNIN